MAAPAYVSVMSNTNDGSGTSLGTTPAASVTAGNCLVVGVVDSATSGNTRSVADTAGNTFTTTGVKIQDASGTIEVFVAKNITGNASNVVTATWGTGVTFRRIIAVQLSGADTAAPFDSGNTAAAAATTVTSGAYTIASADETAVAFASNVAGNTWSAGATGTMRVTALGSDTGCETEAFASAGSKTSAMAQSSAAAAIIAAVAITASAGGGGPTGQGGPYMFNWTFS